MLRMNKRGILTTYLLIFVIISVGFALFLITGEDHHGVIIVGESQLKLIESYTSAETDMFNQEYLIKNSVKNLILELGLYGGILESEKIAGYSLWQKGEEFCYPSLENLNNNLAILLKNDLSIDNLLINSSENSSEFIDIYYNYNHVYSYTINSHEISYFPNVDLHIMYNYSFDDFVLKVETIENIASLCNDDLNCWNDETLSINWINYIVDGKVFKFDIVSKKVKDLIKETNVLIKGAIDFEEYNVALQGSFC